MSTKISMNINIIKRVPKKCSDEQGFGLARFHCATNEYVFETLAYLLLFLISIECDILLENLRTEIWPISIMNEILYSQV